MAKPHILLVNATHGFGGAAIHFFNLYQMLKNNGYHVSMLVPANSTLSAYLQKKQVPHYTTHAARFSFLRPLYHFMLQQSLKKICRTEKIDIIHCNNRTEVTDALALKKKFRVKVAFTRHDSAPFSVKKIQEIDAIIAVSNSIKEYLDNENQTLNLGIPQIASIPPLFDAQSFLSYNTTQDRASFYKENWGITLKQYPIMTMIANFYQNLAHKNHPLLFKALDILIHKKNKPVYVMLAGSGEQQKYLENLSKQHKIDQYVYFLGFYNNIPALLHHADVMVLSSAKEAFPIVYLETGLMKRPAIGAQGSGAEHCIIHEQTGLLFENNNAESLATQMERLIDNKQFAEQLGNQAYDHVLKNFTPEASIKKYMALYDKILSS